MSTDIHALTECFDAVDAALADVKKAKADGFPWTDAVLLANLWSPVKKAVGDAALVVQEAKALDGDDVQTLAQRALQVAEEVAAIFMPAA
jgi:hypothetical protein